MSRTTPTSRLRIAAAFAAIAAAGLGGASPARAGGDGIIAHEWGTFTSMQGSDGVTLEGLQHEEEGLPAFVYSRAEVRDCPLRAQGWKGLETDVAHVTEKMETPVIYFYACRPHDDVRVRVCFNKGLLTQWYPVVDKLGPAEGARDAGPLDMSKVEKSFLEWRFDILEREAKADEIPAVAEGDPWRFARLPASNAIRTAARTAPRAGPQETEKFIFYRGLGTFTLPIRAVTAPGGEVTVHNDGDDAIPAAFLLRNDGYIRWSEVPGIPAHGSVQMRSGPVLKRSGEAQIQALRERLEAAIVAAGLYPQEAEAMTRTWERSYFHTPGLRVLYVVPRKAVDAVLPLVMEPAPQALERVLVGRLEVLTPELEKTAAGALVERGSTDGAVRARGEAELAKLGRFLEPVVRRVLAEPSYSGAHESAREVLAAIARRER